MNKAFSYIRFSSAEQAKGRSQARQMEACVKYCKENNLELATGEDYTFLDKGLSGYHGEHLGDKGQLNRFIKLVEDGTVAEGSWLIIESLDRLSRQDVPTAMRLFLHLIEHGIRIVTLTDNKVYTESSDNIDLIVSILVMSRANEESSTKSKRIRDAMRAKHEKARTQGVPMGRAIPLWLELSEEKQFQVREDRAEVVRRVFQLAIDGYGKAVTAKTLNAEGVASFKGKTWGTSSVDKILNNRAVLGEYQPYSVQVGAEGKRMPSGESIKGYYPAIVDESTYYQAHAAINGRKIAGATKQSDKFNVWQGVAKCVHCHAAMHLINKGKPPKGNSYLQCANARKGLCKGKGKVVRLDHSEEVFRFMLSHMDSLSLIQDSSGKIAKELGEVEGRLVEKKDLLAEYITQFVKMPTTAVNMLISSTEQEVSKLEEDREALQASLAAERIGSVQDFLKRVDLVSYEGRHRANTLLKRLKVVVYVGSGYLVTEKNVAKFVMVYSNGEVGYANVQDEPEDGEWPYTGGGEERMQSLLTRMERRAPFTSKYQTKAFGK